MIKEKLLPQICAEVYELLNVLGQDYIDALPKDIFQNISDKRDLNYENKFNINDGISSENFSKEAINILLGFDLKYWSPYKEKKEKMTIYKKNEAEYQAEINEKYNPNKLFEKQEKESFSNNTSDETENSQDTSLVISNKSIWEKIKSIFIKK